MKDLTNDLVQTSIKHLQNIKNVDDLTDDNTLILMMHTLSLIVVGIQHDDPSLNSIDALKTARIHLNEFLDNCLIRELNEIKKP